jgi:hypothetical protein
MNREQIAARLNMDEMAPWRVRVLNEVESIVREAVEAEREACAKVVETIALQYAEPVWALEIIGDIRADRAKRGTITTKPTDDPAAAWRSEGFNQWRATRASRTTED